MSLRVSYQSAACHSNGQELLSLATCSKPYVRLLSKSSTTHLPITSELQSLESHECLTPSTDTGFSGISSRHPTLIFLARPLTKLVTAAETKRSFPTSSPQPQSCTHLALAHFSGFAKQEKRMSWVVSRCAPIMTLVVYGECMKIVQYLE